MDKIMEIIEQIWAIDLVRFIVYLLIAFIAAGIAKLLVVGLLKLIKVDKLFDKWGINDGPVGTSMTFVGRLVYLIVFLMFLPSALGALGLTSVSDPISNFVSSFVEYLPRIIAAVILVYVGIFVAIIVGQIVKVLLGKTKVDALIPTDDEEGKRVVLLSDIIVKIIMSVIILITIVQALTVLRIDAISGPALMIVESIFGAIPSIILAAVVISVGLLVTSIACSLLQNVLLAAGFDGIVANACMTKRGRQIFVTGHSEYDADTLKNEYLRDKNAGLPIEIPKNYFPGDDDTKDPMVTWRSCANLMYYNWLNYFVYQTTPYNIDEIK